MNRAPQSLIDELQQISVCQLLDAVGSSLAVETAIRPVHPSFRICGPAFTVECAVNDNLTLHHALHLAEAGDVLVVCGLENSGAALWGGLMSLCAQSKRLAGTIIDGSVRDPLEIETLGYPVFCRQFQPRRARKETYGRIHVPIRVGALSISPGDYVFADANGIVSIPSGQLEEMVRLSLQVGQKEDKIKEQICAGRTTFEILGLDELPAMVHSALPGK